MPSTEKASPERTDRGDDAELETVRRSAAAGVDVEEDRRRRPDDEHDGGFGDGPL